MRALSSLRVNRRAIKAAWCILVCCIRNERPRLAHFIDHYRKIGVAHFLLIDNESTDGAAEWSCAQPDCSVWTAHGSYKTAGFGMDWCNRLLGEFGVGKWCVTVDPDEFLVYPFVEYRDLRALTRYMEGIGQPSLLAPLIDAYGGGRLSETMLDETVDPMAVCPYFDRLNICQHFDPARQNYWMQGGVRMRRFFSEFPRRSPALNKVPLVRWLRGYRYISSMHHLNVAALNCTVRNAPLAVSGALFHFKYVNLLAAKAKEELSRREHYAESMEYRGYASIGDTVLFDADVSLKYEGSEQLQRLGFMQAGGWY